MSAISAASNRQQKEWAGVRMDLVTAQRVAEDRVALDVSPQAERLVASDAIDSVATSTNTITAAAHSALIGDVIEMTSGTASGERYHVVATDTNTFVLAQTVGAVAAADTFSILRPQLARLNSSGSPATVAATAAGRMATVAFGSVGAAYATALTNTANIRQLVVSSSLDAEAILSLNGTDDWLLVRVATVGLVIDLAGLGLHHAGNISVKRAAGAPGAGSISITGIA